MIYLRRTITLGMRSLKKIKIKYMVASLVTLVLLEYFGAFTHIFERNFYVEFDYPLEGDITPYIEQLKNKEKPDIQPLNVYNYTFISKCDRKCSEGESSQLRLVYIVKSAMLNFQRRMAIRNSWGFEKRFSDVPIRTVFVLGVSSPGTGDLQQSIENESRNYGDIVQADFLDTYFNNTIKTMIGFQWVMNFCMNSKFYMFVDDDFYVSTKNVLRFLRNPTEYPQYLEMPVIALQQFKKSQERTDLQLKEQSLKLNRRIHQIDFELPDDVKLFSGFVFVSAPHRHRSSKWFVTLSEYPFHMWPPYVTAGAYVLSHAALVDMHYGSLYTKHFRFDDIYLGLVALKAGIEPYHCPEFYFYKKDYSVHAYRYVIASHGYGEPSELAAVWNEQKSIGNA
ncbi:beta-1,3-galactosyltransferase brn isoform X2 [Bacillus rossius redtenbacheri]